MNREQEAVREFHAKHNLTINDKPTIPEEKVHYLRVHLIEEENQELISALDQNDLIGIAHELADNLVVIYGTAISYGIDLEEVFMEIHRSNMTKEIGLLRKDGKIMKGKEWKPPDVLRVLRNQE